MIIKLKIQKMTCVNCANAISKKALKIPGVKSASVDFVSGVGVFEIEDGAGVGGVSGGENGAGVGGVGCGGVGGMGCGGVGGGASGISGGNSAAGATNEISLDGKIAATANAATTTTNEIRQTSTINNTTTTATTNEIYNASASNDTTSEISAKLISSINKLGFIASLDQKPPKSKEPYKIIAGAIISVALFFSAHVYHLYLPSVILAVGGILLCGIDTYAKALRLALGGGFGMEFLISLASVLCFVYSALGVGHLYFFESVFIVVFVRIGKYIESRAKSQIDRYFDTLGDDMSKTASITDGTTISIVSLDKIQIGDTLLVPSGQMVACDGIARTSCMIDTSALDGEYMPKEISPGASVQSGCIVCDGTLELSVSAAYENSYYARLREQAQKVQNTKLKISALADKISAYFVLIVGAIGAVVFGLHYYHSGIDSAIEHAANVLLISCPCALGIAVPLVVSIAINQCFAHNIILKNPLILESINDARCFVFDKTGTLCSPHLSVEHTNLSDEQIALVKSIEANATHPIANALLEYRADISPKALSGVVARHGGLEWQNVRVGAWWFVSGGADDCASGGNSEISLDGTDGNSVAATATTTATNEICQTSANNGAGATAITNEISLDGKYDIYLSIDGKIQGGIKLNNQIKNDAKALIDYLSDKIIAIISGDSKANVAKVASALGIANAHHSASASQKLELLNEYKKQGKIVYVGDGLNDLLSLGAADFALSFGNASALAQQKSDALMLKGDLDAIGALLQIAKRARRTIKQNLALSFCYNVFMIPLAAGAFERFGLGLLPSFCVVFMFASSIAVVYNSSRMLGAKYTIKGYK